jgi:hypothetical protein
MPSLLQGMRDKGGEKSNFSWKTNFGGTHSRRKIIPPTSTINVFAAVISTLAQWKRISHKQSAKWQHLFRVNAFFFLPKNLLVV